MGPALLFCPADRPDRYAKAADRADAVILDLEDAVAPDAKASAREALVRSDLDPAHTVVRLNAAGTADHEADLDALGRTSYRTVMLAKTADADQVRGLRGLDVVALVETATGLLHVAEIAAAPDVVALMWGAEDLVASLGGTASRRPDGVYRDVARYARSATLVAARAHGKVAVDAVHVAIEDHEGLAAEVADAVASGFGATACIHPGQVPVVRAGYRPSPDDVARARDLLEVAAHEAGAFRFRGQLVDGPLVEHARTLVRRAESTGT
ncbi:CoA ester lyase [Actinotalea ferrariae]|uniref:HpcH/HpaI aldolase/citrate lyase family protein n=1 Tax=Actinotalea ferrariae TaxID=1386098 RepID=UPI001C8B37EF|nr:CoA ester lyase [Actinotalea ferrariae]MBX9245213.1 CoA ester lyase [Actinotalea ferrariae]